MIPNKTKEKLVKIANDIHKGAIFTDRHIKNHNDIGMVFMPLMFMGKKEGKGVETEHNDWGTLFEYTSQSLPRSCNGMPIFLSFKILNVHDSKLMWEMYTKIVESEKEMLKKLTSKG